MPFVPGDWSITRANGNIRYIGGDHDGTGGTPSYCTVLQLHRALQDFADNPSSSGDDELDITDTNPTSRFTDNYIELLGNYNLDATALEHLYDGSAVWGGGAEIADGVVNYGNADVQLQIHQDGAVLADDWWNFGGGGLNADANQGISHRFLIQTRTGGADIDGRRVRGTARRFGFSYAEFLINGSARGNNVLALSDAPDLNNATGSGTVATWDQFANDNEGYIGIDVNNDGADEFYYSSLDIGGGTTPASPTINDLYEWWKYQIRDGSAATIYGISGELFRGITHEIDVDTPTGTFNAVEPVSWGAGATAGTGQMLAINSPTAATKMWIQLLTGVAPTDGLTITGGTSLATVAVNVTVTPRTVTPISIGQSTGSAIIGGYGIGIDTTDLTQNDKLFDLTNTQRTPPNNVTYSVAGLASGEDYVFVGPWNGSTLDADGNPAVDAAQLTLNTTLSGATETAVVVTAAIPSDTPSAGTIRIEMDDGRYRRVAYTSWTGSTFTIPSTSFSGDAATAPANVYITYLDVLAGAATESFTVVYNVDRNLIVKVRDGGASPIKEYITAGLLNSNGGGVTAIRTTDL